MDLIWRRLGHPELEIAGPLAWPFWALIDTISASATLTACWPTTCSAGVMLICAAGIYTSQLLPVCVHGADPCSRHIQHVCEPCLPLRNGMGSNLCRRLTLAADVKAVPWDLGSHQGGSGIDPPWNNILSSGLNQNDLQAG